MAISINNRKFINISVSQVENQLVEGLEQGDTDRLNCILGMARIKRIKLINVRRERGRLEAKHGKDNPLVARLDRQMVVEHQLLVDARIEKDRISVEILERKSDRWLLQGYLKDADGHPMGKRKVVLYRNEKMTGKPLLTATTDSKGYYKFNRSIKPPQKSDKGKKPQELAREAIFIGVTDRSGKIIHTEGRPASSVAGGLSYRDIVVDEISGKEVENYPTRFLGNSNSRELHDLTNEKKNCFIDRIRPDHRIYFRNTPQAEKAGYDYCAKCFGEEASKR